MVTDGGDVGGYDDGWQPLVPANTCPKHYFSKHLVVLPMAAIDGIPGRNRMNHIRFQDRDASVSGNGR